MAEGGIVPGRKQFGFYSGEREIITRMQSLKTAGLGFDQIAARLNDDDIPPRSGATWHGIVINRILNRATLQIDPFSVKAELRRNGKYTQMIDTVLRPGYVSLTAVRNLALDSEEWLPLMNDMLHLPMSLLPAVRRAVRKGAWRYAHDPLNSVRENAERDYRREAMRNEKAAVAPRVAR